MEILIDGIIFNGTIDRECGGTGIIRLYGFEAIEPVESFLDLYNKNTVVPISYGNWFAPVLFSSFLIVENQPNYSLEMRYYQHY